MDESVSSAEPAALYEYADRAERSSAELRDAARRLRQALLELTAGCVATPPAARPELADRLRRYLDEVDTWDAWVRRVGPAFEEAGTGELVVPPFASATATALSGSSFGPPGNASVATVSTGGTGAGPTAEAAGATASESTELVGKPGGGSGRPAIVFDATASALPSDEEPDAPSDESFGNPLDGLWTQSDPAGEFYLQTDGGEVRALRGETWACLPGGPVASSGANGDAGGPASDRHFAATRQGNDLVGELAVCWHDGKQRHDWMPATLRLTLSADGEQLTGTWQDQVRRTPVAVTLSRVQVDPLVPEDLGLPPTNLAIRGYGVLTAHRAGGTIANVSDEYALNPDTDAALVRHRGVDFTSRDGSWVMAPLPFAAPVAGTVHVYPDSPWNTIGLRLDTGDWLQFLHASEVLVQTGQRVEAGAVLGPTGATGATAIHLHLQARSPTGAFLDPLAVIDRARRAAPPGPSGG